jgi:hypothetical protein
MMKLKGGDGRRNEKRGKSSFSFFKVKRKRTLNLKKLEPCVHTIKGTLEADKIKREKRKRENQSVRIGNTFIHYPTTLQSYKTNYKSSKPITNWIDRIII